MPLILALAAGGLAVVGVIILAGAGPKPADGVIVILAALVVFLLAKLEKDNDR